MKKNNFFKFRKGNKKASAMPVEMVVIIILAVIGLGIAIWFLYQQLSWTGMVDREVCYQSVVLRGAAWDKWYSSGKDLVPLKCKTRNICITTNKNDVGNCNGRWGSAEFDPVIVSKDLVKQKQDIMKLFSNEMAECFQMMGQGRVKIFPSKTLIDTNKGVVCSQIMLEDNVETRKLSKFWDMAQYLLLHRPPGEDKLSYWEYLINADPESERVLLSAPTTRRGLSEETASMNLSKVHAVVFVEHDNSRIGWFTGATGGAIAGAALGSVVPVVGTGFGIVAGGIAGFIGGGSIGDKIQEEIPNFSEEDGEFYSSLFILEYSVEEFENRGITSLESIESS